MQHRSSRGGAGLGCGGEKPHMEQHGESKGPGPLQQSSTICFEKQKILLFFFFFLFIPLKSFPLDVQPGGITTLKSGDVAFL